MIRRLFVDLSPLRDSRPFRYAFTARLVSLLGIGLLLVALPMQVYQLTGSSLHVAAVSATLAVALCIGSLSGGLIADRADRSRTVQWARAVAGLGFVVLGVNALMPEPQLWVIYIVAVVDGAAGGVSGSALMALMPSLVGRDRLAAAGALVALTTDLGLMITPAIAGIVIAESGVATTYFAAAAATGLTVLLFQGVGPAPPPGGGATQPLQALREALHYAAQHKILRAVLLTGLLAMVISGPLVLLPAFVDIELEAGPRVLGVLYAAPAVGAVLGSLLSGWTGRTQRAGLWLLVAVAAMPFGVFVFGFAKTAVVAFLGLAAYGLASAIQEILQYAVFQRNAAEEMRGRVSSLLMVQGVAGAAAGSLVAGSLGTVFAPGTALLVYGLFGWVLGMALLVSMRSLRAVGALTGGETVSASHSRSTQE
ncbi:enterobactin transporter EntS [Hoyosella sp. YIM 151337]|uniref:enterobactin transporter EntS n=1 Tax=Hoyosella sp. YIM 151337 TaxID=2992742 RepID=UPI002235616C|nr:enterobactin transporter EntS [Hoyosella sp. YIM 151337]MCW4354188.1 enterobactin transporter EntS [Hoyosella sp. YIM 151337]